MRREVFGPLAALDDANLARAIAVIGASSFKLADAPLSFDALCDRYPKAFKKHTQRWKDPVGEFTIPVRALQRYAARPIPHDDTTRLPKLWQQLFGEASPPGTRYCLDLHGVQYEPDIRIDLDWLTTILGGPSLNPRSVFAAWSPEPLSLRWDWPLRVAIAPVPSAADFRTALDGLPYRHMIELIDATSPEARCDVLVFPSSLREALRAAINLTTTRSSAILVLGGLEASWEQSSPWLSSLRRQFHSGAVAACFVPRVERVIWFQGLIEALTHNLPLDSAIFYASSLEWRRRHLSGDSSPDVLTPPLVVGDRDFLDSTRLVETAKRIGRASAALPGDGPPLPQPWDSPENKTLAHFMASTGAALAKFADTLPWHHESGDATSLVEFRRSIERLNPAGLVVPNIVIGGLQKSRPTKRSTPGVLSAYQDEGAPNPTINYAKPQRLLPGRVRIRLDSEIGTSARGLGPVHELREFPATPPRQRAKPIREPASSQGSIERPPGPRKGLRSVQMDLVRSGMRKKQGNVEASTAYTASVFISAKNLGQIISSEQIDESLLPPSAGGHQIRIVFTPLWKDAQGAWPAAQVGHVHLPLKGTSSRALFHFTTPEILDTFRARLALLNGFRVLQTLVLTCQLDKPGVLKPLLLSEENVVTPDFGEMTVAPPFEAALIVNDNPRGVLGLTAITSSGAQFFEPEGFDKLLKDIRDDLGFLNAPDDGTEEVIAGLEDGRVRDLVFRLALRGAAIAKALKRQPQLDAFLVASPLQVVDAVTAKFFPVELTYSGTPPLPDAKICEQSIRVLRDEPDASHASCPNRESPNHICLAEFWGFSKCIERQPLGGQREVTFASPVAGASVLRPLRNALLATSEKVRQADISPPSGLQAVFKNAGIKLATARDWSDWTQKIQDASPSMLVLLPHSLNSAAAAGLPALEIGGTEKASIHVMSSDIVKKDAKECPVVLLLGCSTALPDIPFLSFVGDFRENGAAIVIGTLATIRGRQTVSFISEFLKQLEDVASKTLPFDQAFLRVKRKMLANGDPFVFSLLAYGDTGWRVQA